MTKKELEEKVLELEEKLAELENFKSQMENIIAEISENQNKDRDDIDALRTDVNILKES